MKTLENTLNPLENARSHPTHGRRYLRRQLLSYAHTELLQAGEDSVGEKARLSSASGRGIFCEERRDLENV